MQVTRQLQARKKSKRWREGDTLTARLSYVDGRDQRTVELVNGKPAPTGIWRWRAPLTTEGEFGTLLERIFADRSDTTFRWNRWDEIRGHRVAVFDFWIDRDHSTLELSWGPLGTAVVAYSGSISADPASGAVLRVIETASNIPPELETESVSTIVDYDTVAVGTAEYLLPVCATVSLVTNRDRVRNEIEFKDYRKFEAESTITFAQH